MVAETENLAPGVTETNRLASVELPGTPLLVEVIDFLKDRTHIHTGALIEHWRGTETGRHLAKLATEPVPKLVGDLEREFLDGIEHLLAKPLDQRREQRLAELSRKQPSELTGSEREELLQLLRPAQRTP